MTDTERVSIYGADSETDESLRGEIYAVPSAENAHVEALVNEIALAVEEIRVLREQVVARQAEAFSLRQTVADLESQLKDALIQRAD